MRLRSNITYAPVVSAACVAAFLLALIAASAPFAVHADVVDERQGIVRCGGPDQPPCSVCELFHTANRIVNFSLFNLLVPLATIMLIVGGIMMITSGGSSTQLLRAKNLLQNVLIGIFLAFAAWAIVNTILVAIIKPGTLGRPWNQFPGCQGPAASASPAPAPASAPDTSGFRVQRSAGTHYIEDDALQILSAADISVNDAARTSLEGVSRAAINGVVDLKQRCQCEVVITGGTESGHAGDGTNSPGTHAAGDKLDFRITQSLENYIIRNYIPAPLHPQCHTGNCFQDPLSGRVYVKEGTPPHYDVCFANCAS